VISRFLNPALPDTFLELGAIAIISDLIPLMGVNRSLVKYGLENLRHSKRPGLQAILEEAAIDPQKIGTYEVGFVISPRLNAMGRLEHAIDSLRLLCTKDPQRARDLAKLLGDTNRSRQELTLSSVNHAIATIDQKYGPNLPKIIVVHDASYNQGIIGLIASKLVEKYHRPAIALSVGDSISKASARSVSGFDITQHIRQSSSLLTAVGGHAMAAGFSLDTANLNKLILSLVQ
jgi:single-stranded-DNA-specific exonuclease